MDTHQALHLPPETSPAQKKGGKTIGKNQAIHTPNSMTLLTKCNHQKNLPIRKPPSSKARNTQAKHGDTCPPIPNDHPSSHAAPPPFRRSKHTLSRSMDIILRNHPHHSLKRTTGRNPSTKPPKKRRKNQPQKKADKPKKRLKKTPNQPSTS